MLSAVIIAKDEEDRIEDAIRSVAFAEECLVLDSGSGDATVARAEALGARVLRTDWPGFVAQKNRGWAEAKGDWVLSLDADERVTPELQKSILQALKSPEAEGYRVRRRNLWMGHPLKGGHWYPDARIRLARKSRGRWEGTDPHDHLRVDGPIQELDGDLLHIPYRNFAEHLRTIDRYTAVAATQLRAAGRKAGLLDLYFRPIWRFIAAFFVAGGWKDGVPGLILALLGSLYCALKWARVAGILPIPRE